MKTSFFLKNKFEFWLILGKKHFLKKLKIEFCIFFRKLNLHFVKLMSIVVKRTKNFF